jgi:hypothetical protein
VWAPAWLSALSSLGVWEEGLLELVLLFGVFFSMNTAISTCISISSASISARLSGPTLPSVENCPKRPLSAVNSSRRDCLLRLGTRGNPAAYSPASTLSTAASTARRSPGGKAR